VSLENPTQRPDYENNLIPTDMCHRQLRFIKSTGCGHLTRNGETTVDCQDRTCHLSRAHGTKCVTPHCRRYYEQPERIISYEVSDSRPIVLLHSELVIMCRFQESALSALAEDSTPSKINHIPNLPPLDI